MYMHIYNLLDTNNVFLVYTSHRIYFGKSNEDSTFCPNQMRTHLVNIDESYTYMYPYLVHEDTKYIVVEHLNILLQSRGTLAYACIYGIQT